MYMTLYRTGSVTGLLMMKVQGQPPAGRVGRAVLTQQDSVFDNTVQVSLPQLIKSASALLTKQVLVVLRSWKTGRIFQTIIITL